MAWHTYIQTTKQAIKLTQQQANIQTSNHTPYIHTCTHAHIHRFIQTDKHTYIQAYKHSNKQSDTHIHTFMHAFIHTNTHASRQGTHAYMRT